MRIKMMISPNIIVISARKSAITSVKLIAISWAKSPFQPEGKEAKAKNEYGEEEKASDDHKADEKLRVVGVFVR